MVDLHQYTAPLDPPGVAEGMNAAARSARRLVADAQLLLDHGRYPSAVALAALAIEEAGKIPILRELALARDQKEASEVWKDFRWHTEKNKAWILPDLVADGARKLYDFAEAFDPDAEHPELLDKVKQVALYVDCLADAHWSEPEEVVDESLAKTMVQIAEILAPDREFTAEEVELWVEYLQPVWKKSGEGARIALAAWHDECVDRGLIPGEKGEMSSFVSLGFDLPN